MLLLIEDRPVSRHVLADLLRRSGHEVLEAGDAEQGLSLLNENPVTLVITDFVLPDIDGLKLINLIRERHPAMPVVIISGFLSRESGDTISNIAGKRVRYLLKPVDPTVLEATIKTLLESPP
jgi:two-component system, NtrC family, response regulator AtoC